MRIITLLHESLENVLKTSNTFHLTEFTVMVNYIDNSVSFDYINDPKRIYFKLYGDNPLKGEYSTAKVEGKVLKKSFLEKDDYKKQFKDWLVLSLLIRSPKDFFERSKGTKYRHDGKISPDIRGILKRPEIVVEGITDELYLKKAGRLFGYSKVFMQMDLTHHGGTSPMETLMKHFIRNPKEISYCRRLLLFDCEVKYEEKDINDFISVRKIPFQKSNPINKGIENLFPNSTIEKLITRFGEANIRNRTINGVMVRKINGSIKTDICDWLCGNGTKEDFVNFPKVFSLIENFLKH